MTEGQTPCHKKNSGAGAPLFKIAVKMLLCQLHLLLRAVLIGADRHCIGQRDRLAVLVDQRLLEEALDFPLLVLPFGPCTALLPLMFTYFFVEVFMM